jgi:hypothetical protein
MVLFKEPLSPREEDKIDKDGIKEEEEEKNW